MNVLYYNKNVLDDIDPSILLNPFFEDWYFLVEDILLNDEFQKRKLFNHHHDMSVWDHSLLVSFNSFILSRYFCANPRLTAIAGLLHDFYPQAWLYNEKLEKLEDGKYLKELNVKKSLFKKHGFVHAREAAENYVKYFPYLENKRITDAIKRHMFPLNIIPPRYMEGFIVTLVDKLNSCHELPSIKVVPSYIRSITKKRKKVIKSDI